jgi:hypothetical protein
VRVSTDRTKSSSNFKVSCRIGISNCRPITSPKSLYQIFDVEAVAAPVAAWHLPMELPAVFPIRPANASFVSGFISVREAGSLLGHNPFNLAMNEALHFHLDTSYI